MRASCPRFLERISRTQRTGRSRASRQGVGRHPRETLDAEFSISKKNARKDESEPRVVDVLARLGRATVRPRISRNFERSSSLGRSVRSTRAFLNRNETVKNAVRLVGVADAFVSSLPTALRDPPRPRAFDPRSASPRPFPHAPLKDRLCAHPRVPRARSARGRGARGRPPLRPRARRRLRRRERRARGPAAHTRRRRRDRARPHRTHC